MKIIWIDGGREPLLKPDPRYPDGIDLDLSKGARLVCDIRLPYPAKRCGLYFIKCETCCQNFVVTTAGRPDDPRSVKVACKQEAETSKQFGMS